MRTLAAIPVLELSQVGEVRRQAVALADSLGFDAAAAANVALVATELASNLARHAQQGEVLVRALSRGGVAGVEMVALDRGPGMANVGVCLRDGYSSAGSQGIGLGALQRLSSFFDVHSVAGIGTTLCVHLWACQRDPPPADPLEVGAVCQPHVTEQVCGDAWCVVQEEGRCAAFLADGLGHGLLASEAAVLAVQAFAHNARQKPVAIVEAVHQALRSTRGAAVAVAVLDLARREVGYAGLGNISALIHTPEQCRQMVSQHGTAGQEARKIQQFTYAWPQSALLILHSDGLASHWNLERYPGLMHRHPSLVAATLYRDHRRGRDDVTVVALREPRGGGP